MGTRSPAPDMEDIKRWNSGSPDEEGKDMRKLLKKGSVTAIFLGVMLAASVAFASWLATGTGNGYAKATSAQNLTTSAATPTADLYPGGTGNLKITINNPNPYPVLVTQIARTGGAITSDAGAACDASTGVSMSTPQTVSISVAAGGSTTTTLTGVMSMTNSSDTTCQGATFTVPVTVTGASA